MALINCPECGREISDKASSCPHCGCPSSEWNNKVLKSSVEFDCEDVNKMSDENIGEIILDILQKHNSDEKIEMITELNKRAGCEPKKASIIIDKYLKKLENKAFEISVCPFCNNKIIIDDGYCPICDMRINSVKPKRSTNDVSQIHEEREFHGIYRYGILGGKTEVYCPRCHSQNCSYYQEQKIIPGKTKTRYTANLNPLKPFTLVNKKEKVIKKDKTVTESKIICNDCGWIFD